MGKINTNLYGEMIHARALAEQNDLRIQWIDEHLQEKLARGGDLKDSYQLPYATSRGIIYCPIPDPSWNKDQMDVWRGSLYHEIGHHDPKMRDCFDYQQKYQVDMSSLFGTLLNLVDDYRQEHHRFDEYAGRKQSLGRMRELHLQHYKDIGVLPRKKTDDDNRETMKSLCVFDAIQRERWMRNLSSKIPPLLEELSPLAKERLQKAIELFDGKPSTLKTVEEEAAYVEEIIEHLFELDPEAEKKKAMGDPEGKYGRGSKGKGKGEGEGEEEAGGEGGSKDGDKRGLEGEANYSDLMLNPHGKDEEAPHSPTFTPMTVHYDEGDFPQYIPYNEDEIAYIDWEKRGQHTFDYDPEPTYLEETEEIVGDTKKLSRKLERVLRIATRTRYYFGKKKGRLHNKNMYRVTMADAPGFNERIFKQKDVSEALDVAVSVLGDFSGSMGGSKMTNCCASLVLLHELLQHLDINHEVAGFTDIHTTLYHYLFYKFGARKLSSHKMMERVCSGANVMSENPDGDSILVAYNRLLKQPERRKILIVLSDGQPAGGKGGDIKQYTKDVILSIEKDKRAEIYAIGIQTRSVEGLYKEHEVIKSSQELESALLALIKRKILGK